MEKEKNIKNKGLKLTVIGFIIIGMLFLREDSFSNLIDKLKSFSVKQMSLEYVNKVSLEENAIANLYGENILNWNENILSVMSLDGNILKKKDFKFENPDILFGDENVYVMDKSIGDIYALNKDGEVIERFKTDNNIFNLKEEYGKLINHIKSKDNEGLVILNSKGEEIFKYMELKNILAYSIEEKSSKYMISNMSIENGLESYANIYKSDGSLEDTIKFPGEMILYTQFIGKEQLVLTNLNLYMINGKDIKWKKPYPFIKDIQVIDGEIYMLYDVNLEILNLNGERQEKFVFPKEYKNIFVYDDYAILYGNYDILGIKGGKKVLEYELKEEIKALYKSDDLIGIRLRDSLGLYHLKKKK
jgi:uncharacterized protein DUF5711